MDGNTMKKLIGILGTVGSTAAAVFHVVDPSAVPSKYLPYYVALGSILALIGNHPLKKDNSAPAEP